MKKLYKLLFSPITLAILLIISALSMAIATFIENDFGAEYARHSVYNTRWFELILLLLTINLLGSIFSRKLYVRKKLPVFTFHLAFAIMLIGAGLTRYTGYEGIMHIRQGESVSFITLNEQGLTLTINDGQEKKQVVLTGNPSNLKNISESIKIGDRHINLSVKRYYDNAYPKAMPDSLGSPIIDFVAAGASYRGFNFIKYGETKVIDNLVFSFTDTYQNEDIHFSLKNDSVFIQTKKPLFYGAMTQGSTQTITTDAVHLSTKQLYKTQQITLVAQEIYLKGSIIIHPAKEGGHMDNTPVIELELNENGLKKTVPVWLNNTDQNQDNSCTFNDLQITASYGNLIVNLPFTIHLNKFEIERYPGSNSPSSFSSFVTIKEQGTAEETFHIYMNNILKRHGYRFFQSSYDDDEQGTVLSVNYDIWGSTVSYLGYFILFVGIILSLISKHSYLRGLGKKGKQAAIIIALVLSGGFSHLSASENEWIKDSAVQRQHANAFGKLLIQNTKGRTEPVSTFASEIVRKISRSESLFGLTPTQTFLEMTMNQELWTKLPIIKVTNPELQKTLGITSKYASYIDFVDMRGGYKLGVLINQVYEKSPAQRSKYDKAIMKADEQINICYAVFAGQYLRIFPQQDSLKPEWLTPDHAFTGAKSTDDSLFLSNIMPLYFQELVNAKSNGNYTQANEYLQGIKMYQQKFAFYELPSNFKVNTEALYYKWNVFKKLFPFYASIGIIFLILLIVSIIKGKELPIWLTEGIHSLIFMAFILHTAGLAARWYISGHAPMSNGYESMIFVSWVTLLAGFIFRKQSLFALSATAVLGGLTLMVANLSFMDPEITNLVPVLKSYWLTLHVSVITGSYAFLALGALLGIINQVLYILRINANKDRIDATIESLTQLNHRTLILGLYFLTIGTFLGAIWANESWGRYWGWDPKETWSLITIIVYTFVTHARLIPGIKGVFTFNILSLYGFSAVLMTYFGVNYYLSGLHSYAAGDPVPVPQFVYYAIILMLSLSTMAYVKYKKQ